MPKLTIIVGHVLDALQKIPPQTIDTIVTSPPYYKLRIYGKEAVVKWPDGWEGELGQEPNHEMYIDHLLMVTKRLKIALKNSGCMFWNMGDSYGGVTSMEDPKRRFRGVKMVRKDIPEKSLGLIPFKFAMRMVYEQGWILLSLIHI